MNLGHGVYTRASAVAAELNALRVLIDPGGGGGPINPAFIDHNLLMNTHNLTSSINHNAISNTHNLTTDIDHDTILNTHNLTTDINHNAITNTHQGVAPGNSPTFTGLTLSGLAINSSLYTDGSSELTTTAPGSGTLGFWSRTTGPNVLTPDNAGDSITTTGGIFAAAITATGSINAPIYQDSSLVGCWQFNNNQGIDSSIYGNDGSLEGGATAASDVLELDGVDQYFEIPNDTSLDFNGDPFSLSIWFKTETTTDYITLIDNAYHLAAASYKGYDLILWTALTNQVRFRMSESNGVFTGAIITGKTPRDGKWHHIVATKGTNLKIYYDGVLIDADAIDVSAWDIDNSNSVRLGVSSTTTQDYIGSMDDFEMFSRELSLSEIQQLYVKESKRFGYFNQLTSGYNIINQTSHSQGLVVNGFDTQSAENFLFAVSSGGDSQVIATKSFSMIAGNDFIVDCRHFYVSLGDTGGARKFFLRDGNNAVVSDWDSNGNLDLKAGNLITIGNITGSGGINTKVSTDDVTDPPTDAELDTAFGTPAALGAGFIGILDDNSADIDVWICYTSDTSWFYLQGTKAV